MALTARGDSGRKCLVTGNWWRVRKRCAAEGSLIPLHDGEARVTAYELLVTSDETLAETSPCYNPAGWRMV
jgi:hypothetical protein